MPRKIIILKRMISCLIVTTILFVEAFGQGRSGHRPRRQRPQPVEAVHSNPSRRVQILHQSPPRMGINHSPLHLIRPTFNLLHQPSHHHGPSTRLQLRHPSRLRPRFQRRQRPHPRPHLRKTNHSDAPQKKRPPPRHHVLAANGRRPLHFNLRHGFRRFGGKETARPFPAGSNAERLLVAPSVLSHGQRRSIYLCRTAGVLLR